MGGSNGRHSSVTEYDVRKKKRKKERLWNESKRQLGTGCDGPNLS
jgi:hypothetical protein